MKYPKNHDVDNMDMTVVMSSPKIAPTTEGIRLKNPPDPTPLTMLKKTISPRLEANGQSASAERPTIRREKIMLFTGPRTLSAPKPMPMRPSVLAKFHAARIDAPVWPDRPSDEA
jgi:hypothetical protein